MDDFQVLEGSSNYESGCPTDAPRFMRFCVDYALFSNLPLGSDTLDLWTKTKTLLSHCHFTNDFPIVKGERKIDQKPIPIFSINMTSLGHESDSLYREIDTALQSMEFNGCFRGADGKRIRRESVDKKAFSLPFYEFEELYKNAKPEYNFSASFYKYTKELQFYANRFDMFHHVEETCMAAVEFYQNLGLINLINPEKGLKQAFEIAENTHIAPDAKNQDLFAIDVQNMSEDYRYEMIIAMEKEPFLSHAKLIMDPDYRKFSTEMRKIEGVGFARPNFP